MRSLILTLAIFACALSAQTKKVVITGADADVLKELQAASPKVRVVSVAPAFAAKRFLAAQ